MELQLYSSATFEKRNFIVKFCFVFSKMVFLSVFLFFVAVSAEAQNKIFHKEDSANNSLRIMVIAPSPIGFLSGGLGGGGGDGGPQSTTDTCGNRPPEPTLSITQPNCGETDGTITVNNYQQGYSYRYNIVDSAFTTDITSNTLSLKAGNSYEVATVAVGGCESNTKETVDIISSSTNILANVSTTPFTYLKDDAAIPLKVFAKGNNLTYQWYSTSTVGTNGVAISGATDSSYTPETSILGTTYYYVIVKGSCGNDTSNTASVLNKSTPLPSIILTRQGPQKILCPSAGKVSLVAFPPEGLNPTEPPPTMTWEAKYNSQSDYETVQVGGLVYDAPMDFTRYYRVRLTSNDASDPYTVVSNVVEVAVRLSTHILSDIGGKYTVSDGIPPVISLLNVYGDSNLIYTWYINNVNTNQGGTAIENSNVQSLRTNVTLPGTYYLYATISGGCSSVLSGVVTITTNNTPVAGVINGATSVCSGANSTELSLYHYTGTVQWQSSVDNINFSNIPVATSPTYTATNLTVPTWYRVLVTAGATATSESAEITMKPLPVITQDLKTGTYVTSKNGKPITLSVEASGYMLTYQWYSSLSGTLPAPVGSGGQTSSFSPDENEGMFYNYYVVINGCGSVRSKTAVVYTAPEIVPDANNIVYVTTSGNGNQSGSNWANAARSIQNAINTPNVHSIWVANGTYYSDQGGAYSIGDRQASFFLKNNISIYGGFAGTETSLSQRDSTRVTNNTILSGDIGTINDNTDNAYHVVVSAGDVGSATLNGFTVQDGYANGTGSIQVNGQDVVDNVGGGIVINSSAPFINNVSILTNYAGDAGGMYNKNASPILTNLVISNNNVPEYGGGIYNFNSSPLFTNIIISGNNAGVSGGGICNYSSSPVITNVLMNGNIAGNGGGGLFNINSSNPVLTNVTITGNNITNGSGAGINNQIASSPQIRNSIIYGNKDGIANSDGTSVPVISYSLVQGGLPDGTGNIDGDTHDPAFVSPVNYESAPNTAGDYRLRNFTSPAFNTGNSDYYNAGQSPDLSAITKDLDGNPRKEGVIDMGPYESLTALPVSLTNFTAKAVGTQAKLQWSTASEINNKEFIISRSVDGSHFTEIGKVAGVGNSNSEHDYTFYDETPMNGNNFYKLEQIDFDGHRTIAGIRLLTFSSLDKINIYPNSVKQLLQIEFDPGIYQRIEVTDVNGRILKVFKIGIIETRKELNMSNLTSGAYFIRFVGNGKIRTSRVVKE